MTRGHNVVADGRQTLIHTLSNPHTNDLFTTDGQMDRPTNADRLTDEPTDRWMDGKKPLIESGVCDLKHNRPLTDKKDDLKNQRHFTP